MRIWIDAQSPPRIAFWIRETLQIDAFAMRELGLRDAEDAVIFHAARDADVAVLTKDRDFPDLLQRFGPPPKVIWLTCGNTSNAAMQAILRQTLPRAVAMLNSGETIVEISSFPVLMP